jgi:lipopolysaccharide export system protein LptA
VVLRLAGGELLPGLPAAASGAGIREVRADQLDLDLKPEGTPRDVAASGNASVTLLPQPGEPRERRTLEGGVLGFHWNKAGVLTEIHGQRDTRFLAEALPPARGPARSVKSRRMLARLDPETGRVREIDFEQDVELERGGQRGLAPHAVYSGEQQLLSLLDKATLVDAPAGTRLDADAIEIFTRTGDMRARYNLRYTVEPQPGGGAFGLFQSKGEPVFVSGLGFEYSAETKTARFFQGALLRSGRSEVRAREIRIRDAEAGRRRLDAEGEVTSRLAPPAQAGKEAPVVTEGAADALAYDESARRLTYSGNARIVQGEVSTASPEAVILLSADGERFERLEAGAPVEIRQGERVAKGARAVYTPGERAIVVSGEQAELREPGRQVNGRVLTFFLGADRILVDGREEARTESVFRRTPPSPKP